MRLDGLPVLVPVPCFFRLGLIRYFAFFFLFLSCHRGIDGTDVGVELERGILEPGEAGRMGWKEDSRRRRMGRPGLGLTRALHTLPT